MHKDVKNGLPKTVGSGNIQATRKGEHHEIVDGCFENPEKFRALLLHTSCPKIQEAARKKIQNKIQDPTEKRELLDLLPQIQEVEELQGI